MREERGTSEQLAKPMKDPTPERRRRVKLDSETNKANPLEATACCTMPTTVKRQMQEFRLCKDWDLQRRTDKAPDINTSHELTELFKAHMFYMKNRALPNNFAYIDEFRFQLDVAKILETSEEFCLHL